MISIFKAPLSLLLLAAIAAQATPHRIKRQSISFELGHQDPDACVPPTGGEGRCVAVQLCPPIFAILSMRPIPSHQFAFLRRSICRRDGRGRPMFCCSKSSSGTVNFNPGQPATTTTTTTPPPPPTTSTTSTSPPTTTPPPPPTTTQPPATTPAPPTDAPATVPPPTEPPTSPPRTEVPPVQPTILPAVEVTETDRSEPFMLSTTPNPVEENTMVVITDGAETVEGTGGADPATEAEHAGPAILPRITECGNSDVVLPRIVGGRNVNKNDWPWIAALGYADGRGKISFSCGAALITKRHVLTAAHCIQGQPSLKVVRLGEHDLSVDDEVVHQDYGVIRKIVHESYDSNFQNDIAILVLDRDVVFIDQIISPVCLPQPEFFTTRSLVASLPYVAGWGSIQYNERTSDILRDVAVPIIETESCAKSYERFKSLIVDNKTLCAGYASGGKDACQGDSGGPLVLPSSHNNKSKFFLIGVVSLGFRCAEPGFPGIYTRVTHFLPWLYENLA